MQLELLEIETAPARPPSTAWFLESERPTLAICYGAGRDSTALIVKLKLLGIRPDVILFSDTGGEKDSTYAFLPIFGAWLASVEFPPITVLNYNEGSKYESLEDECIRKSILPGIAFNKHTCSIKWKQDPFKKFMNHYAPARLAWRRYEKVIRAIGFEATECKRINRATTFVASKPDAKFDNWFPLVEWGMNLDDCIETIIDAGLPVPPKSSCFYCSAMKLEEIEELARTEPHNFERALRMEAKALPRLTKIKGLGGRAFAWRDLECAKPFIAAIENK